MTGLFLSQLRTVRWLIPKMRAVERTVQRDKDQDKRRGLICRADDRLDPVIQLAPPLNIPQEDADQVVAIVADVIHALGRKMGTQPTMEAVSLPLPSQSIAVG